MRTLLTRATRVLATTVRSSNSNAAAVARAAACTVEALEGRRLLSTYYVSPGGSDSNAGTSASKAWKSISRVNRKDLNPGDRVLFQGGKTFTGSLSFGSEDAGTSSNPVRIGSYGSGRATIRTGSGRGIAVSNLGGFVVEDLVVQGTSFSRTNFGIKITNNKGGRKSYIRINNVDVSGFGEYGINVVGERGTAGFNDVRITNSSVHNNVIAGVKVHNVQKRGYSHTNVYIGNVKAYNNFGSRSKTVSGSGIEVSNVDGAVIERSVAYNNSTKGKGAVAIWAHDSNRVTIQYNEAYDQHTNSHADGTGFGFDTNTRNSIMQYNWSHDNDGHGINLAQWRKNDSFTNNIIRYNILEDNGRKNGYSGISMWGRVLNTHVYNNTIHQSHRSSKNGSSNRGIRIFKTGTEGLNGGNRNVYPDNIFVRNNIIIARGGARLVEISSDVVKSGIDIHFQNNAYWTYGSKFAIHHGNSSYSSLAKWRSSRGQEKLNGRAVGFQVDPKLNKPGQGWTVNNSNRLHTMNAYKLNSGSILARKSISAGSLASTSGKDLGAGVFGPASSSSSSGSSSSGSSSSGSSSGARPAQVQVPSKSSGSSSSGSSSSGSNSSGNANGRPRVLSTTTANNKITLRFSENVSGSLSRSDVVVTNKTRYGKVSWRYTKLSYDKSSNTATLTFPGLKNDRLLPGTHSVRVMGGRVTDAGGTKMGSDYVKNFNASSSSSSSSSTGSTPAEVSNGSSGSRSSGTTSGRPRVLSTTTANNKITLRFSGNVSGSLSRSDVAVTNKTRYGKVSWSDTRLTYNKSNNTATLTFPGLKNDRLLPGTHSVRVMGGRVSDAGGDKMGIDFVKTFRI